MLVPGTDKAIEAFDNERLYVCKAAIEFVVIVEDMLEQLARGRGCPAEELGRAGASSPQYRRGSRGLQNRTEVAAANCFDANDEGS